MEVHLLLAFSAWHHFTVWISDFHGERFGNCIPVLQFLMPLGEFLTQIMLL